MVVDFMQSWLRFRIGDLSDYLSSPLVMVFAGFRESVESKEHCDIWYSIVQQGSCQHTFALLQHIVQLLLPI